MASCLKQRTSVWYLPKNVAHVEPTSIAWDMRVSGYRGLGHAAPVPFKRNAQRFGR